MEHNTVYFMDIFLSSKSEVFILFFWYFHGRILNFLKENLKESCFLWSACGRWSKESSTWPHGQGFLLAVREPWLETQARWHCACPGWQIVMAVSVTPPKGCASIPHNRHEGPLSSGLGCGVCTLAENAGRAGGSGQPQSPRIIEWRVFRDTSWVFNFLSFLPSQVLSPKFLSQVLQPLWLPFLPMSLPHSVLLSSACLGCESLCNLDHRCCSF